jgi:hypothetical protein
MGRGEEFCWFEKKKHREYEKNRFPMPDEMLFLLYKKKKAEEFVKKDKFSAGGGIGIRGAGNEEDFNVSLAGI